jgi:putative Mg2+ transporter-C (MgtC) family protein
LSVEAEWAALSMTAAVLGGAIIGIERQVRQRMAGVRTNGLVALGACSFVIFSQLFPNEPSQTRVAAQIVSGVGFLGAGLIFRDGFRLHGLNTAATLWCSAAVGMMCGAGAYALALILVTMVLILNLFLRPVLHFLDRQIFHAAASAQRVQLRLICRSDREEELRALALRMLIQAGYRLAEMDSHPSEDGAGVEVVLTLTGPDDESGLEKAVALIAVEPGVSHVDGQVLED